MTYEDIKNKLSTSEEEYDENKLTLAVDLRTKDRGELQKFGLNEEYIYRETLNSLVDEYVESFLHIYRIMSDYSWEGNEFEAAIISNLCSELKNVKEYVINSLFKDEDELLKYLKKKINIKVYV